MCKTKPDAGELNLGDIDSFALLSSCFDTKDEVLHKHTEKVALSICNLRILSDQGEDLDLKMELVAILYKLKLSANPNIPTLFKGIGRALGKYLTVECDFVADVTEQQNTHEMIVTKILTDGYAMYKNNRLSEMKLVNLLEMVRDMDYQDVLTVQEKDEAVYMPQIVDKKTYLNALDKIAHV